MRAGSTPCVVWARKTAARSPRAHERQAELARVGPLPRPGQHHQAGHSAEPAQLAAGAAHVDDGLLGPGQRTGSHHGHAVQRVGAAGAALGQRPQASGERIAVLRRLPARLDDVHHVQHPGAVAGHDDAQLDVVDQRLRHQLGAQRVAVDNEFAFPIFGVGAPGKGPDRVMGQLEIHVTS